MKKLPLGIVTFVAVCLGFGAMMSLIVRHVFTRPGYSGCMKCERSWDAVEGHTTYIEWTKPGEMHMLMSGENVPATNIFGSNIPKELADIISKPQPTRGCFILCESCWKKLKTPEARLPYYRRLFTERGWDEADWPAVKAGVLAEREHHAIGTSGSIGTVSDQTAK